MAHHTTTPTSVDVAVLGGGLAGLVAAAHAAGLGARVLLLERSPVLGGRARSRDVDGYTINLGAHALYRGGAADRGLRELGIELTGGTPRAGLAEIDGVRRPLPTSPLGLLRAPTVGFRARLQVLRFLAATARPVDPSTDGIGFVELVERRTSDPAARALLLALGRLTTYTADENVSARAALTMLRASALHGVRYLDGGWGSMVAAMARAATDRGVRIAVGAGRVGVAQGATGWEVSSAVGRVTARALVVAVGTPRSALAVLDGAVPASVLDPLRERRAVRVAALDLALRRLPRPATTFVLGVDEPLYLSVHSEVAALAPHGGAVVHLVRYLRAGGTGTPRDRGAMEALMDRVQPGWRDALVDARFLPALDVAGDVADVRRGGVAGRAPVELGDGLLLAGDWVGGDGMLTDAVFSSARVAGRSAARTARTRSDRAVVTR